VLLQHVQNDGEVVGDLARDWLILLTNQLHRDLIFLFGLGKIRLGKQLCQFDPCLHITWCRGSHLFEVRHGLPVAAIASIQCA